ncbi:glycosyltransferase family 2 protein [Solirubrobacter ginsenosidimutans]|uniref:Glycosyltransferase family 2 protein n=1 Tax=Solirubrobacter ginsenosidimutans TaxID=490573 RepID=A0A9X3S0U0_9ACTN|nr:glycosyltransferase family 2 protein [Solirubrobacter ginsenosidimutans]MDA0161684.1 glycosyltransferase family 2 protein [Solirubrobacter ginsenosidimutans]
MTATDTVTPGTRRALSSLSIVLPCFNEAPNVLAAVTEARQAAERFAHQHEIVVVDDGSSDDTLAIAEALAAKDPRVRVVAHDGNRGYGAAVRSGIAASQGDWVLLTDGDLQFDLSELSRFLDLTAGHELVAGYRLGRADPRWRLLAAGAWNGLMRHSFGIGVRDVDCAFKLVRGPSLRALALTCDGAMVSTELLVRGRMAGWRFAEVGVQHRPRLAGEPTGGDIRVILRAFRERQALLRRLRAERRSASAAQRTAVA